MGGIRTGKELGIEIFIALAKWGDASFHNLFHKPGHAPPRGNRPEKVSYFFNIYRNLGSYSKVTIPRSAPLSDGVWAAQNPHGQEEQRP
jgi:hypothetical protein